MPPGMPLIYWFSRRMTLWGSISFNLAVFINIIIAFFYPYVEGASTGEAAARLPTCAGGKGGGGGMGKHPCTACGQGMLWGSRDRHTLWPHGRQRARAHTHTCTRTCRCAPDT